MKHVFIINPTAGKSNRSASLRKQIKEVFNGQEVYVELTSYAGQAKEIAEGYAQMGVETCFYACGGDGTLVEIVNGIYKYPKSYLAIVPIGTGNDFIKSFGHLNKKDFLDLSKLKDGNIVESDLLKCKDEVCLNIASVGFDANVVENVHRFKRLPLVGGIFAYNLSVFYCFLSAIKSKHSLLIDDTTFIEPREYVFVVAANGRYYGGGFNPTPMAKIDDGYIDVLTITALSRLRILRLISIYKKGQHLKYDFVTHYRCKKVKIMSDKDVILNMDGETHLEKDPEIEIIPNKIKIILPKK